MIISNLAEYSARSFLFIAIGFLCSLSFCAVPTLRVGTAQEKN